MELQSPTSVRLPRVARQALLLRCRSGFCVFLGLFEVREWVGWGGVVDSAGLWGGDMAGCCWADR